MNFSQSVLPVLCERVGPWVLDHIGSGVDWELRGEEHHRRLFETPNVAVLWHGRLLLLAYFFRNCGYHVMISAHRDGEMLARAVERIGFKAIRGSTTRGGSIAFKNAVQVLREGGRVGLTPDGPKGPRHTVQPGAVQAAAAARVPIFPVIASASPAHVFKSWDRQIFPRDGSKAVVEILPPIDPPDDSNVEACRAMLERTMADATEALDRELGVVIP